MAGWFGIKDPIGGIFAFIGIAIIFFIVFFSIVACATYVKEVVCSHGEVEPYDSDDDQARPRRQQQQQQQRQRQQPVRQQPVQQPRPSVPPPLSRQQQQQQQQQNPPQQKTTPQRSTPSRQPTSSQQQQQPKPQRPSQQQSAQQQQSRPQRVASTSQAHSTSASPGAVSRPAQAQVAAKNQTPPSYTPLAQPPPSYATDVELRNLEGQDVGVLKRRLEEIKMWAENDRDEVEAAISQADIDHLKDWIRKLEERQARSKKLAVASKPSASSSSSAGPGT